MFKGFAELGQPVPNRAPGRVKKLVANPRNSMFGGKTRGRQDLDAGEPLTQLPGPAPAAGRASLAHEDKQLPFICSHTATASSQIT